MGNTCLKSSAATWCAMAALSAVVFAASSGAQRAAEPAAPPLPDKKLSYRDITLTVHARKALGDDPELGALNLGVRVQDNVAVLWGPAPSEELKRRAAEVVKQVKGVHEVRDADVYVAAARAAVAVPAAPPPPEGPTRTESASPDADTPVIGSLTGRPDGPAGPVPVVVLRPPLPTAGGSATVAPPPERLAGALEMARRSDPRFAALECRLDGDVVTLAAGRGKPEDVMAFARAISHLPGLARVVIGADEAAPR